MNHFTLPSFWKDFARLPSGIQQLARKNYELLRNEPMHPSLHFKKVLGKPLWSVRVGAHYRALGYEDADGIVWFWIGTHADYDRILS
jgi:hypothetical protein